METSKNTLPDPDIWQKQPAAQRMGGFCTIKSKDRIHNGGNRKGIIRGNPGPYASTRKVRKTDEIRATLRDQCLGQPDVALNLDGFLGERQDTAPLKSDYIIKQAEHREETEPEIESLLSRQYNPYYGK